MIGALSQRQGQFRIGKYLGLNQTINDADAPFFTYEIMGEREKRYNQIVQNLITTEESVIIRTNYNHKWLNQAIVVLQDKRKYLINNIKYYEEEVNPQSFAITNESSDTLYYLELIGVDEDE